MVEPIGIEPMT